MLRECLRRASLSVAFSSDHIDVGARLPIGEGASLPMARLSELQLRARKPGSSESRERSEIAHPRSAEAGNRSRRACGTMCPSMRFCSMPILEVARSKRWSSGGSICGWDRVPMSAPSFVHELNERLRPEIERRGFRKLYDEIELPLAGVLARMEQTRDPHRHQRTARLSD